MIGMIILIAVVMTWGQIITSLPWLPPVGVAPENGATQSTTYTDSRRESQDNNNTRIMWMRGAARIQKQVFCCATDEGRFSK